MTQILLDLANRPPAPRDGAAPATGDEGVFAERLHDATNARAEGAAGSARGDRSDAPSEPGAGPADGGPESPQATPPPAASGAAGIEANPRPAESGEPTDEEPTEAEHAAAIGSVAVDVVSAVDPGQFPIGQFPIVDAAAAPTAEATAAAEPIFVDPSSGPSTGTPTGEAGAPAPPDTDDQLGPRLIETAVQEAEPQTERLPAPGDTGETAPSTPGVVADDGSTENAPSGSANGIEAAAIPGAGSERAPVSASGPESANQASSTESTPTAEADHGPAADRPHGRGGQGEEGASTSALSPLEPADTPRPTEEAAAPAEEAAPDPDNQPPPASRPGGPGEANLSRIAAGRIGSTLGAEPTDDAGPRIDPARFVNRVSGAFQAAQERGGEVRLRLSPPELGVLQIKLTVSEGVMTASLETENPAARNALLDNLPALRDRLAEQAIRIEKFDVDVRQEGGGDADRWAPGERQERSNEDERGRERRPRTGPDTPAATSPAGAQPPATVDGRINVVA